MIDRFAETFQTEDGNRFKGEFGDPGAAPRPRREIQNLPHRALTTSNRTVAKAGMLVYWNHAYYLLMGQHTLENTYRFLAVEANTLVTWKRATVVLDPVSRVEKSSTTLILRSNLPIVVDAQRGIEEQNFDKYQYRIFTSEDVQKGDMLDDWMVMNVYDVLGVRVAEVM